MIKIFCATDVRPLPGMSSFDYYNACCPEGYDMGYVLREWEYGYDHVVYYRTAKPPYKEFLPEHSSKTTEIKYVDLNNGMETTCEVHYNKKRGLKRVTHYIREDF